MKTIQIYKNDKLVYTDIDSINLLTAISKMFKIDYSKVNSIVSRLSHDYNKPINAVYSFWVGGHLYYALWLEKVQKLNKNPNYYTSFEIAKNL